jgi:hypothetical protein
MVFPVAAYALCAGVSRAPSTHPPGGVRLRPLRAVLGDAGAG